MPKGNGDIKKQRKFSSLSATLKLKPFSTNKMYTGRKRRSVWYRSYEKEVHSLLKYCEVPNHGTRLQLHIIFGTSTPLFDCDNVNKPLIDCLSKYYHFNDNQIYLITTRKRLVSKGDEYITFDLKKFRGAVDERRKYRKERKGGRDKKGGGKTSK